MKTFIVVAGLVLSTLSVSSLDAEQKCGGLSMDPACARPSTPKPNVTFGQKKPAPAVPRQSSEAPKVAPVQEVLAALAEAKAHAAIDCKMAVIVPTTPTQGNMPVIRPTPDVTFSMRVVPTDRCDGGRR